MSENYADVRRDPRYRPRPGSCIIVFEHPVTGRRCKADLKQLGIAGLSFTVDAPIDGMSGALLSGIQLEVGSCILTGDFLVKNAESLDQGKSIFGGLFLPANQECALRLEGIIHGLHAADGSG